MVLTWQEISSCLPAAADLLGVTSCCSANTPSCSGHLRALKAHYSAHSMACRHTFQWACQAPMHGSVRSTVVVSCVLTASQLASARTHVRARMRTYGTDLVTNQWGHGHPCACFTTDGQVPCYRSHTKKATQDQPEEYASAQE